MPRDNSHYSQYPQGEITSEEAMQGAAMAAQEAAQLAAYGQISSRQENARPDLIKWIIEGSDLKTELRHKLLGEVEIEKGKWKHYPERQILNSVGVNEVMSFVEMVITKESTTTILSEEDILLTTRMIGHSFNRLICYNQQKYGISVDKIELCVMAILHCIKVALMRSKDGKMLQLIQTVERRQEIYTEKPQESKRKGIFGLFGRR